MSSPLYAQNEYQHDYYSLENFKPIDYFPLVLKNITQEKNMKMNQLLVSFFVSGFSVTAMAAKDKSLQCIDTAVKAAVQTNYSNFGASTSSCGIKLLNKGNYSETYVVCTTDETDPMEYVVVVTPSSYNQQTESSETCKVKFVDSTSDASTPTFESEEGLLKSIACSIDNGDEKLICK
jgi:hypothetical protein